MIKKLLISMFAVFVTGANAAGDVSPYQAGVARVNITPDIGLWMSGYASRKVPAEGKEHDLWAKALALKDANGRTLVLVTTDLVGISRSISVAVTDEVTKRTSLPRECLMLTCSHTHCGPVIRDNLIDMYDMPAEQRPKLAAYSEQLQKKLVQVVIDALAKMQPVRLEVGEGTCRFAVNRRQPTDNGIINGINPAGPVDHAVPVLRVRGNDGKMLAVVFGYACHNTTLSYLKWCGDYAGFAQLYLEEKHPGATAMFWSGCGADANPLPRGTVELAQKYGKQLADAVTDVCNGSMTGVAGAFAAKYATIELAFSPPQSREKWVADSVGKNFGAKARALKALQTLDAGGKLDDRYSHYPIQVWRLGDQVTWVALGGEVVVDYTLRLRKELAGDRTVWITAYANDVMAYIPSLRVLQEGGYEGDTSMIPYGLPSKWAPSIEEKIVSQVLTMTRVLNSP